MGDAEADDPVGRRALDFGALEGDRARATAAAGREMVRRVVVLPAPFEPMSATSSPCATRSDTPWSERMLP